ncbi:DNA-binding protein [Mesorhizobium sp. CAU 1741]|uniref:DNA-binding protein n=1 Tax=Mesorhizobium sp. CAU 1741 TaxID=3140366 RepID=UPI00325B0FBD
MNEVVEEEVVGGKVAYRINEFCAAFGVGKSLVFEEIAAGRLRTKKAGRRTLIPARDASAWLEALPEGRLP